VIDWTDASPLQISGFVVDLVVESGSVDDFWPSNGQWEGFGLPPPHPQVQFVWGWGLLWCLKVLPGKNLVMGEYGYSSSTAYLLARVLGAIFG